MHAGQAIVHFATHEVTKQDYAIKFFLSHSAFREELVQYTDAASPLRHFLPAVHAIVDNSEGKLRDGNGHPLPSCIVMEKGESLDIWRKRSVRGMDTFTCMQVLLRASSPRTKCSPGLVALRASVCPFLSHSSLS